MTEQNITAEITPNPNTLKFNLPGRSLVETGSANFTDAQKAKGVLLPETLFAIPNVLGVMIGKDFVTVTKRPEATWNTMADPIIKTLKELLASGKALLPAGYAPIAAAEGDHGAGNEIERRIREILDAEIRPAVAMDGGDITFHGYQDGIVTLHLQGSCSSCPSSVLTLKMGVENRLKSLIPEIREVVQV
jgi:Fe-S cluster biogenesis protein NfuA